MDENLLSDREHRVQTRLEPELLPSPDQQRDSVLDVILFRWSGLVTSEGANLPNLRSGGRARLGDEPLVAK